MNIDENVLTQMVDASAKAAYARAIERAVAAETIEPFSLPEWDQLPPLEKNRWRQQVMLHVWDAVEAMPDPSHRVWEEGREAGRADTLYEMGERESVDYPHENPYPAPEVSA